MAPAFASGHKDDVALARIHIIVLQDEELIDAVFLESCDPDDCADGPDQTAIKHEVLLAADLTDGERIPVISRQRFCSLPEPVSLTYTLQQVEQVLASFDTDLLDAEFRAGSHDGDGARGGFFFSLFLFCYWVKQLGSSVLVAKC